MQSLTEEEWKLVRGRCTIDERVVYDSAVILQTACRRVASLAQANEVRSLSAAPLFLWQHAVPRMDEREARCSPRGLCARSSVLQTSSGGQKATSSRHSPGGSGARKQSTSTNFSNRCESATTFNDCMLAAWHVHLLTFCCFAVQTDTQGGSSTAVPEREAASSQPIEAQSSCSRHHSYSADDNPWGPSHARAYRPLRF